MLAQAGFDPAALSEQELLETVLALLPPEHFQETLRRVDFDAQHPEADLEADYQRALERAQSILAQREASRRD